MGVGITAKCAARALARSARAPYWAERYPHRFFSAWNFLQSVGDNDVSQRENAILYRLSQLEDEISKSEILFDTSDGEASLGKHPKASLKRIV